MDQADLLTHAIDVLETVAVPYMVVGSIASGAYGEPRMTQDIDIVIQPTPAQLNQLCAAFPPPDFYVSIEAAQTALQQSGQFNVLDPSSGGKIDFMIARTDPWGREQISRRQRIQVQPGREGFAARPEDLIISKLLYYQEGGSEKHLRDITGMLKISGDR
ncbi:MAG: hypothetical protein ACREJC_13475, partial [Tepidisphaeraceae bacterium]